jgi:hypothetical protein
MKRVFEFRPTEGPGAGITVDELTANDEDLALTLPTGQVVVVQVPQTKKTMNKPRLARFKHVRGARVYEQIFPQKFQDLKSGDESFFWHRGGANEATTTMRNEPPPPPQHLRDVCQDALPPLPPAPWPQEFEPRWDHWQGPLVLSLCAVSATPRRVVVTHVAGKAAAATAAAATESQPQPQSYNSLDVIDVMDEELFDEDEWDLCEEEGNKNPLDAAYPLMLHY